MYQIREHKRYRVMHNYLVFDQTSKTLLGRVVDISMGGFRLLSQGPVPEGITMACRLVFPAPVNGAREMTFEAATRWCFKESDRFNWEVGFELMKLSDEQLEIQKAIIRDLDQQVRTASC